MGRGETPKATMGMEEWEKKLAAAGNNISKEDMNFLIMNYLVTEGYVEAARAFERESGTSPGLELSSITDRMEVRRAVQGGHIETAIDKVNDMNPEILENQGELLFHLHQQRLIELIRSGNIEEALAFAAEYLAPAGEEQPRLLEELERTVALLAFNEPRSSPLSHLLEAAQRQKTASELNAAILSAQAQEKEPRLPQLLRLLLWAQGQLDSKATYPRITDLASGQLELPKPE